MAEKDHPQINISSIKVAGVGGLGMVAIMAIMAYVLPEVRGFAVIACTGGIITGAAFIAYRRWIRPEDPHGPILMVEPTPQTREANESAAADPKIKLTAAVT
jgi:hypothetical protein